MTVSTGGKPHLIYAWEDSTSDVHYATKSGGSWSIETIILADGKWRAGYSLAFGLGGTLHELHSEPDAVWHLWNDGSGWQQEVVTFQQLFYGTSLAIDAEGYLHGTYALYGNSSLVYITNESGTWDELVIDWCGGDADGDDARLMLDSTNAVHIVYADRSLTGVRYATNASGAWEIAKFDPPRGWDGWFVSASMGPDDTVHVADYNEDECSLFYLTNASGEWTRRRLAGFKYTVDQPIITDAGDIHTSIAQLYAPGLYYGSSDGVTWTMEEVSTSLLASLGNVAVGPDGTKHLAVASDETTEIYYAEKAIDGGWQLATLDVGDFAIPILRTDSLGRPRVVYHKRAPENHVVYAERNDDVWEYEQLLISA
ncbi:MAG: hypothetical protein M5R36_06495 [Deltaproteobacteria bacterium]|nr:hypothetical protein [Deltaproteobacteria bacterium]